MSEELEHSSTSNTRATRIFDLCTNDRQRITTMFQTTVPAKLVDDPQAPSGHITFHRLSSTQASSNRAKKQSNNNVKAM